MDFLKSRKQTSRSTSCRGDNLANISQIKKKSIRIVSKVINKLNSLNLRRYYFEM